MTTLVSAEWVAKRLEAPHFALLDPRRPMKYLQRLVKLTPLVYILIF